MGRELRQEDQRAQKEVIIRKNSSKNLLSPTGSSSGNQQATQMFNAGLGNSGSQN